MRGHDDPLIVGKRVQVGLPACTFDPGPACRSTATAPRDLTVGRITALCPHLGGFVEMPEGHPSLEIVEIPRRSAVAAWIRNAAAACTAGALSIASHAASEGSTYPATRGPASKLRGVNYFCRSEEEARVLGQTEPRRRLCEPHRHGARPHHASSGTALPSRRGRPVRFASSANSPTTHNPDLRKSARRRCRPGG